MTENHPRTNFDSRYLGMSDSHWVFARFLCNSWFYFKVSDSFSRLLIDFCSVILLRSIETCALICRCHFTKWSQRAEIRCTAWVSESSCSCKGDNKRIHPWPLLWVCSVSCVWHLYYIPHFAKSLVLSGWYYCCLLELFTWNYTSILIHIYIDLPCFVWLS